MDKYKTTWTTWNKLAQIYQDSFMDLDLYNDSYDSFCEMISKPNAAILEIGCGPGNITKYLLSKREDFEIQAIDVAPAMLELARKNNPQVQYAVMDCRDIDQIKDRYDGIMCGFCLPYLTKTDSAKMITNCAKLLNPFGVLYLSFIEGDYSNSGFETGTTGDRMYVNYYKLDDLKQIFEDCGFELVDVIHKHYTKGDGRIEGHLILLAQV
jgi:2-polyprenyl-3-methyl-5-hydroxy-6-metoxy-1,4-benzoquinol methylase